MAALVEAEGRVLRQQIGRTAAAVILLGMGAGLLLAGVGLLLVALFHWLEPIWGRAASFASVGTLCCLAAGGIVLWSYRWLR